MRAWSFHRLIIILAAASLLCGCGVGGHSSAARVGKPLPAWKDGYLDIHAINTGRGECTFFVLPDGTTMMVDAGDMETYKTKKYENVPQKPSEDVHPYEVYAAYARHFMPAVSGDSLDIFVLSHYHSDHLGLKPGSGVMGLHTLLPFRTIIDRSYPDYDGALAQDSAKNLPEYVAMVRDAASSGAAAEKFEVGSSSQIGLRHDLSKYNFKVVNYAAGGVAWDGEKCVDTHATRENAMSCSFKLTYGAFDYWTSGDNNSLPQVQLMAPAVGEVEAMKCMHHMSNPDVISEEQKFLKPQVMVTQSFFVREIQPHQEVIRAYGPSTDLFFTNIASSLAKDKPETYGLCKNMGGHVVIRVCPGGSEFFVYVLKDTDFSFEVLASFGPYFCK